MKGKIILLMILGLFFAIPRSGLAHNNIGTGPYNPKLLVDMAATSYNLERYEEAESEARRAIMFDPNLAEAHVVLGAALSKMGERDKGIQKILYALKLNPRLSVAHAILGDIQYDSEKYSLAIISYKKAIELEPQKPGYHSNISLAYCNEGLYFFAEKHYKESLRLGSKRIPELEEKLYPRQSDIVLKMEYKIDNPKSIRFDEDQNCLFVDVSNDGKKLTITVLDSSRCKFNYDSSNESNRLELYTLKKDGKAYYLFQLNFPYP